MPRSQSRKGSVIVILTFVAMFLFLFLSALNAQEQEGRKMIAHPAPAYPEVAKRLSITGVVKVQVVIAPDGHIKETKFIGGHPLLVDAVQGTLKNWKYESAGAESTAVLEFHFNP